MERLLGRCSGLVVLINCEEVKIGPIISVFIEVDFYSIGKFKCVSGISIKNPGF